MPEPSTHLPELLDTLEEFHGMPAAGWPVDPYEFLVWWHCGYPPSDAACAKGWAKLTSGVGIGPEELLKASPAKLGGALKAGGMVPELRALRLKEIALRVVNECGGDLLGALTGSVTNARKLLKKFPNIADPRGGSNSIICGTCAGGGGAFELPTGSGADFAGARAGKLWRELPHRARGHRRRDSGDVGGSPARLSSAEEARPGNL
jgi:hypothetical protein